MTLSVDEIKCCRKITVKGIYGKQDVLRSFVQAFKKKLSSINMDGQGVSMTEFLDDT